MAHNTFDIVSRVAGCVAVIGVIALWRDIQSPDAISTTREGANRALSAAGEWAKWMAGVQTATLGGLAWFLAGDNHKVLNDLSGWSLTFAVAALMFSGAGLFCCAWVLSATSSIAIRVYAITEPEPDPKFDVHEASIYAAEGYPKLGNVMAVQHWVWSCGLVAFALFVLSR